MESIKTSYLRGDRKEKRKLRIGLCSYSRFLSIPFYLTLSVAFASKSLLFGGRQQRVFYKVPQPVAYSGIQEEIVLFEQQQ